MVAIASNYRMINRVLKILKVLKVLEVFKLKVFKGHKLSGTL